MINEILEHLNINEKSSGGSTGSNWTSVSDKYIDSVSPVDGKIIATVSLPSRQDYDQIVTTAEEAFVYWRSVPAPKRGEIVRQIGNELRKNKRELGTLVSYEMGKSLQEGLGEVQEMIDICDFAVGLSRQLYGLSMNSERPQHRMTEQWHPLGVVGIISAFNFPVAVWAWNAAIAWVCGDVCVWKPSEKTPLSAIACQNIAAKIFKENNLPEGISGLVMGEREAGQWLASDQRIPLVSATGSVKMGRSIAVAVGERLGRPLLELGGNNAIIITETADLSIAIPGVVFGAVGTGGQRCTSTRRLIIHENIYEDVKSMLVSAYAQLKIGDPLDEANHVGPLIDKLAVDAYQNAIKRVVEQGGNFIVEAGVLSGGAYESGCYVRPCVAEVNDSFAIVSEETFAPLLYIMKYKTLEEAISIQNNVPQGLSSSIMTNDMRQAENFLSASGSDCGIANVNIGTSGAEIGGAFGGEKETGGGRESGSDAWKLYMRRQPNNVNYGTTLPLAQGIKFDI